MNKYMNIAVNEAKKAYESNNTPVGAVIVKNNKIIAKAHNKKNSKNISLYHAEILAIIKACKKLKSWRLDDCQIYVTLEPCNMCLYVIAETRIKDIFYLLHSNYKNVEKSNYNSIIKQIIEDEYKYKQLLSNFFKLKR